MDMKRRDFLKALAGMLGAAAGCATQVPQAADATVTLTPAHKAFEWVEFDPGVLIEFPLDFIGSARDNSFTPLLLNEVRRDDGGLVDYRPEALAAIGDCVIVPTFDMAAWGDTGQQAEDALYRRIDRWAGAMLLAAVQGHQNFPAASRRVLAAQFADHFGPDAKVLLVEHDGWLIGVDERRRGDSLCMASRHMLAVYKDPTPPGGHYAFAELGMAVLKRDCLVCGRIEVA